MRFKNWKLYYQEVCVKGLTSAWVVNHMKVELKTTLLRYHV